MNEDQKKLDEHLKRMGWGYWVPHTILARLFEEGGELARLVNHLFGPKPKKSEEAEQELEMEVGDVYYTRICFANSQGIDLSQALKKCIQKGEVRDKDRKV